MNAVIANLNAPEEKTIAAEKFANDKNTATEVQAYAKIAGNNWTYYVKALNVTIGRNEETVEHPDGSTTGTDIVLGPSKLVSRSHASINYNLNTRSWELYVTGRNGAKVNTVKVPCGANAVPTELNSGAVLDIGGTQMMFILPDAQPIVSRAILDQVAPKLHLLSLREWHWMFLSLRILFLDRRLSTITPHHSTIVEQRGFRDP